MYREVNGEKKATGREWAETYFASSGLGSTKKGNYRFLATREEVKQPPLPGMEETRSVAGVGESERRLLHAPNELKGSLAQLHPAYSSRGSLQDAEDRPQDPSYLASFGAQGASPRALLLPVLCHVENARTMDAAGCLCDRP